MKQNKLNRRQFLVAAGIGSAGAATALVAGTTAPAPATAVVKAAPPAVKGYHVSAHIEKYYKTTLI